MGKPQTFDIIAVSIPDSNVQMAVARIMVGADRYLSMQEALDKVKEPPVLLFKGMEPKEAEQHLTKLKALGVGFRVVPAAGTGDDFIMRDDDLPNAPKRMTSVAAQPAAEAALADILTPGAAPPVVSVQDAISLHHSDPRGAHVGARTVVGGRIDTNVAGFGSSGGTHVGGGHSGGGSGIRAGGTGLDALRRSEVASQKKARLVSVATAAVVVVIALLFYFLPNSDKIRVNKITIPGTAGDVATSQRQKGRGGAAEENAPAAGGGGSSQPESERQISGGDSDNGTPRGDNLDKPRSSVNNRQKQQANSYVDSAKAPGADIDKQVAFYKIAISFNRYNLQAWHGLLQTYREQNKTADARDTEAAMREIFGAEVNSVNAAVTQFGEIIDAYTNESGAYRVEYKTKKSSKDEILRDVFNLTRAIRSSCNCHNISVYASTGPGNGLMVHSTAATSVHTLPDFSRQANILWFD